MGNENSGRLSGQERRDFTELIQKSYGYLLKNFYKFTEDRRYHLALEIIKKAMPQKVDTPPVEVKNYVQIYQPESYSSEDVEAASRPTNRSV